MQRRDFLIQTGAAGVLSTVAASAVAEEGAKSNGEGEKFKLKYAPHHGHFENSVGADYLDQVKYAADQGFTAWEDNGMKQRSPKLQEQIGKTLADLGMTMGVFVAHGEFS